jgi:hypothetical protein
MDTGDARNAWSPQMAFWNTVGTIVGSVAGLAALVIAIVALLRG